MKKTEWIALGVILSALSPSPLLISCSSPEQQAQQKVDKAIDEAADLKKEDVATTIAGLKAQVDRAVEDAGSLPSQELQADVVKQDLDEIQKRLEAAVDLRSEELKAELQQSADRLDDLIAQVDEAAGKATGEAKAQLEAYSTYLNTLKEETVKAINES